MKTMFIVLCLLGGTFAVGRDPWWPESSADENSDMFSDLAPMPVLPDVEWEPANDGVYTLDGSVPGGVAKRSRAPRFKLRSFGHGLRYLLLQPRPLLAKGRAGRRMHSRWNREFE
ncbi:hypothetical protein Bbelb_275450 [Branchiostoma belcheri]|nr:hypothetical protein Bbelb_275450 [Branchiostoma belcheri]